MKRFTDIFLAGLGLLVLGVPLLFLGLLIRVKLGSPIFFRQVRPGLNSRPFKMIKFRTMTDERGVDGELLPDAIRLTALGRFLRTTSLDEMPELWNVLKGDMSLVGPRPLLMEYLPYYSIEELIRHDVRPGITGLAQINGRNLSNWNVRLAYDVEYVKRRNFALDAKILFKTILKVLNREGVLAVPSSAYQKLSDERGAK